VMGSCEHCKRSTIYESDNCKLELTEKGRQWVLYNEYPLWKAKAEYVEWLNRDKK
jgi:hypothetical protein